jgi:RNA-splicing ligase RtcB
MYQVGSAIVYALTVEESALQQVAEIEASAIGGASAHMRVMPDCHSGKGCVIGTTMHVIDKVIPSVVGVDIGCGVLAYHIVDSLSHEDVLALDAYCSSSVVAGHHVHQIALEDSGVDLLQQLYCFDSLRSVDYLARSMGSLGGGNHFIELDVASDGSHWLMVHSGSRHLGVEVAGYYQAFADEMGYIEGELLDHYLHDVDICQQWAHQSRMSILDDVVSALGWSVDDSLESIHNYIDVDEMILRKGAISAHLGESCLIPLNMRDGVLLCVGRGSAEWNYSAPHGAGRLMSRGQAKREISLDAFVDSMSHIVSSSVCVDTIDESPFAYKDYQEIMSIIGDTVDIIDRLMPVFNFKAS